jgi:hypothetical protein
LVGAQLGVALANRRQQLDHVRRDLLLEVAVAGTGELALDLGRLAAAGGGEDVDQVGDPGLLGATPDLAAGVGDGAGEFLANRVGLIEN